ncbi:DEAD/DEAH box helicase [Trueperella pecoris]|uniref:DEAD/DEAH box helicase n=1 Tax=Trueperella pecoris TaxID=2733571 RepID=A0A7M1QWF6_9ACTO|nr:DEAD/DEAH box helicase [Trueperella pecoris]QOQ39039.1 DEAD/DEAH box helicase [Trueperella pecoris]QOR46329.1 DEAD/DEAH box helicase [Trueperella pecoris]QTG76155.1 DEAD/DEAH box helicase [Trueperella pecoris]
MNFHGLNHFVDSGSLARGLVYATQGKSLVHSVTEDTIEAESEGSNGEIYSQWIEYALDTDFTSFYGQCSCPVGYNCKHCVSATLIALDLLPTQVKPASSIPSPTMADALTGWRRDMMIMLGVGLGGDGKLALAFDYTAPRQPIPGIPMWKQQSVGKLEILAMREGNRDKWIKSGASLSYLRNGGGEHFQISQAKAVREFVKACDLNMNHSSALFHDTLMMTWVRSPLVAQYLKKCIDAGVELIDAKTKRPLSIDPEPAVASIELTDTGNYLQLVPRLEHPRLGTDYLLVGSPRQLVIWHDGELHLAFIEPTASEEWTYLRDHEVVVPATEREYFERVFLPTLRSVGDLRTNGYVLPEPPRASLRLTLTTTPGPVVNAAWEWVYSDNHGNVFGTYSLWSAPTGQRSREAEAEIRREVSPVVQRVCPPMMGERLHEACKLQGEHLLTLGELTRELRDIGVDVIEDIPAFRRAEDIHVDVDVQESRDWLDLKMAVVVDGQQVELHELLYAFAAGERFTYVGDVYVDLASPDLAKLRQLIDEARLLDDRRRSALRVPKIRQSWWQDLLDLGVIRAAENRWLEAVRHAEEPTPATVPDGLNAKLRSYQEAGFRWLCALRDAGLGGVLADDMGLGKTIQVLAMILRDRERNPGSPWLVVAPTSVVGNWVAEAGRFAPSLKVVGVESTKRIRGTSLAEVAADADVVVTSYTLMRLEADEYRALGITGLVLDEAQNVKNAKSKGFAVAASLGAPSVFAVTGTPIENNLGELWAMFALSAPGLLGSAEKFNDAFRKPIEKAEGRGCEELMATLRRRIGPFLLRRTKQSVSLDLPPKQEQVLHVELRGAHKRMYEVQLEKERQRVLGLEDEDRIEILSALTRLRQLAIDPRLGDEESSAPTSKMDELMPLLDSLVAEGHSALVFSQFTRFLKLVAARLDEAGIPYLYLDGATKGRPALIKRFSRGEAPIFLISLKAGGTGLNLTMADYAILTDPWWNPAAEDQAVDRAHRIGQTRPVHVYRLVSAGTIEEKVVALQDQKRRLLGVISEDGGVSAKLSAAELRALLD